GGTLQMVHENLQVVWLNVCVLGRTPKKVVRMLHDELVERRRRRNEHRAGGPPPAPRKVKQPEPPKPAITQASSDPISIPSSRAFVVTTPRIRPSRSPRSISHHSPGKQRPR